MFGPVLRGKVVIMRPFAMADAETFVRWLADLEVTRTLLRIFPPSIEGEHEWIERVGKSEQDLMWGLEYEGRLVGTTGLHNIDWLNQHATTGTMIGDRSAWGKGIGGETMRLRTQYCFTQLPLRKLMSSYLDGNEASARAQSAAGYREIGRRRESYFRDGRWIDEVLTEVMREDWLKANPPD
jgi:diamine N-acetyltransferase